MKTRRDLLVASVLLMLLFLTGCFLREEDEATAQSTDLPAKSLEPDIIPVDTLLGQVVSILPREKQTDPFVVRFKYYLDKVGHDSTLTLTIPTTAIKERIESYDYCLAAFQATDQQNTVQSLQVLNLRKHRMWVEKNGKTTLWLYMYCGQEYIARVFHD